MVCVTDKSHVQQVICLRHMNGTPQIDDGTEMLAAGEGSVIIVNGVTNVEVLGEQCLLVSKSSASLKLCWVCLIFHCLRFSSSYFSLQVNVEYSASDFTFTHQLHPKI